MSIILSMMVVAAAASSCELDDSYLESFERLKSDFAGDARIEALHHSRVKTMQRYVNSWRTLPTYSRVKEHIEALPGSISTSIRVEVGNPWGMYEIVWIVVSGENSPKVISGRKGIIEIRPIAKDSWMTFLELLEPLKVDSLQSTVRVSVFDGATHAVSVCSGGYESQFVAYGLPVGVTTRVPSSEGQDAAQAGLVEAVLALSVDTGDPKIRN